MLTLLPEHVEILKKKPQQLPALTNKLLLSSANAHHPHNRLLPATDVQHLLNIYSQYSLTSNNKDAAYQLLSANSLAMLLKVNFGQLSENKLYGAVLLQYTQILQKINEVLRSDQVQTFSIQLKLIGRGIILTKIILKLLQRTHAFLPEYYRFARIAICILSTLLEKEQLQSCPLSEKEKPETLSLRICFSKKVSKEYVFHLINDLQRQFKHLTTTCPSSKDIDILKEIRQQIEELQKKLPEEEQRLLTLQEEKEQPEKEGHIYIQEPIAVRELTPRFYDEEKSTVMTKLRRKKQKLQKKIQIDLRKSVQLKQQQAQVLEDVRKERSQRQYKKELLVIEKQTAEAKKMFKKTQKVKQIQKDSKGGKTNLKNRLDKLSQKKRK